MKDAHPLKAYRDRHAPPLSQQDLADKLGVVRETVARWETGARKIDDEKLADVAGGHRAAALRVEEIGPLWPFTSELSQGPQLGPSERVGTGYAVFEALDVQVASLEVHLVPAQPNGL